MVKLSQHSSILEPAVLKAAVKNPIAKQLEKGDLGPCHSLKLSPVNLDENFVAANEVGVGNYPIPESPSSDSEMCVILDKPVLYPEASNRSLEKYSLAEAWKNSPILEPAVLKAAVKNPISEQLEKGDLDPCHSPKVSPVNLDENFVAANEVGVSNHPNP